MMDYTSLFQPCLKTFTPPPPLPSSTEEGIEVQVLLIVGHSTGHSPPIIQVELGHEPVDLLHYSGCLQVHPQSRQIIHLWLLFGMRSSSVFITDGGMIAIATDASCFSSVP